jgi:subtilisin-like proprotein convertase family protein
MKRALFLGVLLLCVAGSGSAQMVWDYAASFSKPGYFAIPSSPALQFSGSISLECWVNPVNISSPSDQTLLCKYNAPGTGFDLTLRSGRIFFEIGGTPRLLGKTVIPNGQWTHIAVVYDSTTQTLTGYINGNVDSLRTSLNAPIRWNTDSLLLGIFQNYPNTTQYSGLLDEVRIWNRAVSQDEIRRNMYTTLAFVSGPYTGVVLSIGFQYLAQAPNPYAPADWSGNYLEVNARGNVLGVQVGTGPSSKLVPNESVRFDGNGYLSTPSADVNNYGSSHTLQCWVWPDSIQSGTLLQKREGSNQVGYTVYLWGGKAAFRINSSTWLMSRQELLTRQWTHVAVVYNDTTRSVSLYLNGTLDTTATPVGIAPPVQSSDSLFIGTGFNGAFRGYIDNVVMSGNVWSRQQIAQWMATGIDVWNKPPDVPPMCVYNFDGSLVSVVLSDYRMKFNGSARFSHPAYFSSVPASPMLRADEQGYPRGFRLKMSDRRIPASTTQGPMLDDSLYVSEDVSVLSMRLAITVNHTMTTDMVVSLVGPMGDSVTIFNRGELRSPVMNINTIYDDGADSAIAYNKSLAWLPRVKPLNPFLSTFSGTSAKGYWKLRIRDVAGGDIGRLYIWGLQFNNQSITGVDESSERVLPDQPKLLQNYPNPFNPKTVVRYQLPVASRVRIAVYDLLGREVAVLANEMKDAGSHDVIFDGSGLASGVYFYRIQAGDFAETRRMLLVR